MDAYAIKYQIWYGGSPKRSKIIMFNKQWLPLAIWRRLHLK